MPDEWGDFEDGFRRHVRNLGYVPPEFQNHGRFGMDEPPEFDFPRDTSNAAMRKLMPMHDWWAIEAAAELSHRIRNGNASTPEYARARAGYGDLGREDFIIPDQRNLLN